MNTFKAILLFIPLAIAILVLVTGLVNKQTIITKEQLSPPRFNYLLLFTSLFIVGYGSFVFFKFKQAEEERKELIRP